MAVSAKFYFENKVDINQVLEVIKSFGTNVDEDLVSGFTFGYIPFEFDGNKYQVWFQPDNYTSGGKRDSTAPDTISTSYHPENIAILRKIGSYFGGNLNECDYNDDEIYIPKTMGVETVDFDMLKSMLRPSGVSSVLKNLFMSPSQDELKNLALFFEKMKSSVFANYASSKF